MLCRHTSIFVGFDIAFMYSKTILEISSRTNILLQAVFTGYQVDNIIAITMKNPPCIISSIGDTACEIIRIYQIIFANVTIVTTSDGIRSVIFVVRNRRNKTDKQKQNIVRIKETVLDKNAINLTSTELSESQKMLSRKGPSFVPTPSDINWYEVRRDFDKFINQLRYRVTHTTEITSNQEILTEPGTADNINLIPNPRRKKSTTSRLYRSKQTKCTSLELFIEAMENDLFNPSNVRKPRNNLNKNEKLALKEIKSWSDKVIRV